MMDQIQIFNNEEFGNIRTVDDNGTIWFVAKDICDALELSNSRMALENLEEDEVNKTYIIDSVGRQQETNTINESGLYALVIRSNKPNAKKFRKWITSDVLPSIRKHGAYMTEQTIESVIANPDNMIKLLTALKDEQNMRKQLEVKVEENKPKVLFADCVASSHTSILVRDLAKLLRQNGMEIGEKRLYEKLRQHGYLTRGNNMPTQKSMELGLFELKEGHYINSVGASVTTLTPKVTGKGQIYFINKFLKEIQNNMEV